MSRWLADMVVHQSLKITSMFKQLSTLSTTNPSPTKSITISEVCITMPDVKKWRQKVKSPSPKSTSPLPGCSLLLRPSEPVVLGWAAQQPQGHLLRTSPGQPRALSCLAISCSKHETFLSAYDALYMFPVFIPSFCSNFLRESMQVSPFLHPS